MSAASDKMPAKLLIVEDDPGLQRQLRWCFEPLRGAAGDRRVSRRSTSCASTSRLSCCRTSGCRRTRKACARGSRRSRRSWRSHPHTKVIVVTGNDDRENAVRAVGHGRLRFLPEAGRHRRAAPDRAARLPACTRSKQENRSLQRRHGASPLDGIIAASDPMLQRLPHDREGRARRSATTLLLGESGTGKELLARALHALSRAGDQAVRRDQLRGDSRDAAGERAVRAREGRVHRCRQADPGQDRDRQRRHAVPGRDRRHAAVAAGQAAALPAGARGRARRRARGAIPVDVRVVCATNQDLAASIAAGPFPPGPLLPHQRSHGADPAACASATATAWSSRSTCSTTAPGGTAAPCAGSLPMPSRAIAGVSLARQHPRAGEQDQWRGDHGGGQAGDRGGSGAGRCDRRYRRS